MTTITFLTSGRITYDLPGHTLYESIALTARGDVFPHLNALGREETQTFAQQELSNNLTHIYSALSAQCLDTAEVLVQTTGLPLTPLPDLLPFPFALEDLLSSEEFSSLEDQRFPLLRKRFVEALFDDRLLIPQSEVKKRLSSLLPYLAQKHPQEHILCISHAYFIHLLSIYKAVGERMFEDKELLLHHFAPEKEPLGRLRRTTFTV